MKRTVKSALVLALTASLVFGSVGVADAKAKKPKLSKSKVTITVGKTKKITVKKAKPKKTKWTLTKKGKKIVKLSKKTKKSVVIKGKKKGKATVTAKITVGKKTYKKKVKVTVKAKKKPVNTPTPKVTATPTPGNVTPTPTTSGGNPSTDDPTPTPTPSNPSTDNPPTDNPPTDNPPTQNPPTNVPSDGQEIDLANSVGASSKGVTTNADGSVTVEGGPMLIKLPKMYTAGEEVKLLIKGNNGGDNGFRFYLVEGEIDKAMSDIAESFTDGIPSGEFTWEKTLTVSADSQGDYLLFKGRDWQTPIDTLTITSIVVLSDEKEDPKPTYDPSKPYEIDLATSVTPNGNGKGTITHNDDGSVTIEDVNMSVALPKEYELGKEVKLEIKGKNESNDAFRFYLTEGEADARASAVATSSADDITNNGEFTWNKTMTVSDEDGHSKASHILFKGPTFDKNIVKLTITSITVLPEKEVSPDAPKEDDLEEVKWTYNKATGNYEFEELAADNFVLEINGEQAMLTKEDVEKLFNITSSSWTSAAGFEQKDAYGNTIVVGPLTGGNTRTVTANGDDYTVVSADGSNFDITGPDGKTATVVVDSTSYTVKNASNKTIISVTKDEYGVFNLVVDADWADSVGLVLSTVVEKEAEKAPQA